MESSNVLPVHIAIIMDGNGRWAKQRNLPRSEGHRAGADAVRKIVTYCRRLKIPLLTLFAFSSENWSRPPKEIAALFGLLLEFLHKETQLLQEQGIALKVIGDMEGMPAPQKTALKIAISKTAKGKNMCLNLAINYGGRAEIANAVRQMLASGLRADDITEESVGKFLYTAEQPDPDLLIRTSGEQRLSNFLLYQCAYSELYFTPVLWPDFDETELEKAIQSYASRNRRFGKTSENL